MKIIIAYIPVLHAGYKHFLEKHSDAKILYVLGKDLIQEIDYSRKEIRALEPEVIRKAADSIWSGEIKILTHKDIKELCQGPTVSVVIPDEDVTVHLAEKYLTNHDVLKDKVFLRWNRNNAELTGVVVPDKSVNVTELNKEFLDKLSEESQKTSDWWLQVGALVARDNKILIAAHNRSDQSPHQVWSEGDPRNCFFRGVNAELTTSLHAERVIVAEAAKKGIVLDGSSMFVTHFPCPTCAKLVAAAGINKLYYLQGYSILDGQSALEQRGVEIIKVEGAGLPERGDDFLPYPEKHSTAEQ